MEHDLLLTRKDGSVRCFRIYDRPIPKNGDIVTVPIDGQSIKASVKGSPERPEMAVLADAEAVEIWDPIIAPGVNIEVTIPGSGVIAVGAREEEFALALSLNGPLASFA